MNEVGKLEGGRCLREKREHISFYFEGVPLVAEKEGVWGREKFEN